jgi:hypothetical protein
MRRPPPMAVGAANLALGEFLEDRWPGKSALHHLVERQAFRGWMDMIELQDQGIALTAIDPAVIQKVGPQAPLPFDPSSPKQTTVSFDVRAAIASVVRTAISSEALATDVLTGASLLVSIVKAFIGLRLTTTGACIARLLLFAEMQLRPAELGCGSTTVAVRAPHLAFLNLGSHRRPTACLLDQLVDGLTLLGGIDVVEFQDQRVQPRRNPRMYARPGSARPASSTPGFARWIGRSFG